MATLWAVLLLPAYDAAGQEDGRDAAVRGEWALACEQFAAAEAEAQSPQRLAAAREQALARLGPALDQLARQKRWQELAEVAALGLRLDARQRRYTSAAARAEKEGVAAPTESDARLRPWATYGLDYGDALVRLHECLDFLVQTQEPEGHWQVAKQGGAESNGPGISALALLALAPWRPVEAERAAEALLRGQRKNGDFVSRDRMHWIYSQAIATEALAEYALITTQQEKFRVPLERAVGQLVAAQSPGAGWRYEPGGEESDTSITARVMRALRAAQRVGADVESSVIENGGAFVAKMTEERTGRIGYVARGSSTARPEGLEARFPGERSEAMCAAGCLALVIRGDDPLILARTFARIELVAPAADAPDMYYWESGTAAWMAGQGQMPAPWYGALVKAASVQRAEDGSVPASGPWGSDGGRIYATAVVAIALGAPAQAAGPKVPRASRFLQGRERRVIVPGWTEATPTGIYVDSGSVLQIDATGVIEPHKGSPSIGPQGGSKKLGATRTGGGFGSLLGRIDDGKPFRITLGKPNSMRAFGHLWLMVNDADAADNEGAFEVTIALIR